jgi:signal peptidase complex subunit 3
MGFMHNVTGRISSAFFFGVTVLGLLAGLNSLSSYFIEYDGKAEIGNVKLLTFRPNKAFGWDEADFVFDITADLSQVYNWNVKLLFVWIEVDYTTANFERNSVTIWDKIILRDQLDSTNGVFQFKEAKNKYKMRTKEYDLRGAKIDFRIKWEVVPIAGLNFYMEGKGSSMTLPKSYID